MLKTLGSRFLLSALALSVAAAIVLTLPATTALAGKPKPPPPPPPPVTYALQVYDMPTTEAGGISANSYKMANDGTVVGYFRQTQLYQPYLYDSATDQAFNLNDVGVTGLPSGWRIATALGINNLGFVVGSIEEIANPGTWHGYILDIRATPPALTPLPDGPDHTYPRGINDKMEIVGVRLNANGNWRAYVFNALEDSATTDLGFDVLGHERVEINNPLPGFPTQVATKRASDNSIIRYTVDTAVATALFQTDGGPMDISSTGVVCGGMPIPHGNKGYMAFRYSDSLETLSQMGWPAAINGHGDMPSGRSLYYEGTGLINLDNTLTGDAGDLNIWANAVAVGQSDLTERGAVNPLVPDFPAICGTLTDSTYTLVRGFVLIPVATP